MDSNYNMSQAVTCIYNRKIFEFRKLILDEKIDRKTFKKLVDKCLGMVFTRWKYSNAFQVVSNTMTKVVGKVTRMKGGNSITLKYRKK